MYDLIRGPWQRHSLFIYAMEDSITWGRVEAGLILAQYDVHDIDLHAYWYLARQPSTYRVLERLSPNTEFGRMF